tara:strand:- start:273 stop:392 length:120 start_codon:yes stop_codon:yes gene_type:complete
MSDITIHKINFPLGVLNVGVSKNGIFMIEFDSNKRIETH